MNVALRRPMTRASCTAFRGDALVMPEIGIEIPVSELYEAITFEDEETNS